ncbi:MAG: LPXTG cell wall anchor domain-containing protein [Lachnospiraceae bacterium]|nr:LPXTG cell wall anchor domain-containing protein [Lachnospiraceae bacterium]
MRMRMVKGLTAVLCAAMLAPVGAAAVLPGLEMVAEATNTGTGGENTDNPGGNNNSSVTGNPEELLQKAKDGAENQLKDYQLYIDPDKKETARLDDIISKAVDQIKNMSTAEGVERYITRTEKEMDDVMNPPNDDDDDEDDDPAPVSADHLLMVGGNWVTPVANAGQAVSIVLPVVNMGKTMVTDAVVTPVLSTDTTSWPFEITSSNYSQTIKDLPGTDTGMSDMDRRREVTWDLKTRSDVGNGYQKISFKIVYRDSEGNSQETTLDTYVQLSGTAGVGADGKASVPRVVVTGFETEPKDVHAGESFMLTLHLKNTSTATSVNNMIFEIVAAVEGKDEDTTYAAFLPTAGSSTIFVDSIGKNGTRDIQIEMEAKADLTQKPYAVDVNMSYEDEHVNAYTNKTSVSIPVKQEARVDISEPEVMPSSIEVGSESNIMFNIYNMGKTKLYNVQVKTESDTVSGGDAFIGNLDSGATGSVDIYVIGQSATMDEGLIRLQISYEDETGASTVIEKEVSLFVNESMMEDFTGDDMMMGDDSMLDEAGTGSTGTYAAVVVGVIVIAGIIGAVIYMKRKKKKEQQSLEEDILDLDDDNTKL